MLTVHMTTKHGTIAAKKILERGDIILLGDSKEIGSIYLGSTKELGTGAPYKREVLLNSGEFIWKLGDIQEDSIRWFASTDADDVVENAKMIVYLNFGVYGIREATCPSEEFNQLDEANQGAELRRLLDSYFSNL